MSANGDTTAKAIFGPIGSQGTGCQASIFALHSYAEVLSDGVSVHPSVCPLRADIVSKRRKLGSRSSSGLWFWAHKIRQESPREKAFN